MKKKNAGQIPRGAWRMTATAWLAALLLAGCGGGGGGGGSGSGSGSSGSGNITASSAAIIESGSPAATGDTATDGINWFNYRRSQMGLAPLARNVLIDKAATNHSGYQAQNNVLTHDEVSSRPGYTGADSGSRLRAAGYAFPATNYGYGEVISKTGDASGFNSAEALITAIYHRFVVFEPKFQQAGGGSARASDGYLYFTTDFAAPNFASGGLGTGRLLPYPYPNQVNIPTVFYSDQEEPDPIADRNEVGYPISVHADLTSRITVQSFTITPRGGAALETRSVNNINNSNGAITAAAIIPLAVLSAQTTYDVRFSGAVDGVAASLSWSFTTR